MTFYRDLLKTILNYIADSITLPQRVPLCSYFFEPFSKIINLLDKKKLVLITSISSQNENFLVLCFGFSYRPQIVMTTYVF